MKFLIPVTVGILLLFSNRAFGQAYKDQSFTFEYTVGSGNWAPYERIISEYFKSFPFMTDTGNLSQQKMGIGFSATHLEDRSFIGIRLGGFRSTAYADGDAPTGDRWNEIILVKCQATELFGGFMFIRSDWFRMGISGGLALNVVKMKSERTTDRFPLAKEGKYVLLNGGNLNNFKNSMFCSLRFGLPIDIGRKFVIGIEPFYSLPLWKVNTSEKRDQLLPNSTPAGDKNYYKGFMPYGGVRCIVAVGGFKT